MKISDAEGKVLDLLWEKGPIDAVEAAAELGEREGWGDPTVRTLLTRLIAKKAAAKTKEGRRFVYRALIQRDDYALAESETLIDRFFGGRLGPLVVQFAEGGKLSKEDIEDLKRLIAELGDDD